MIFRFQIFATQFGNLGKRGDLVFSKLSNQLWSDTANLRQIIPGGNQATALPDLLSAPSAADCLS